MLIFSMGVSLDGYIADREGSINWTPPSDELFRFHIEQVASLGAYLCGRRLYEIMRVWDTDPAFRQTADHAAFADLWAALPKVVFSRTLKSVEGNARLATGSLAEEIARLGADDKPACIAGADLASGAIELDLVDEYRLFRHPIILGGGAPYLPARREALRLALVETRTFDSGVIFERYRRDRVGLPAVG